MAELLSDTGAPVADDDLDSDPALAAALAEASGEVEAAACLGQRYVIEEDRNDLAALTDNAAAFLAGMVAHLAMFRIWSRRPALLASREPPPLYERAERFLEQLRLGERVFGILESHRAADTDSEADSPSDVENRNGIVFQSSRLFGTRTNRQRS